MADDERVIPLEGFPEPAAGASLPVLVETVSSTTLSYLTSVRTGRGFAVLTFPMCNATKFGYPNDEALPGHALYDKGLSYYGVFEVLNSSWDAQLTEQNRVRFPNTPPSIRRHFVVTFKDSTLECLAQDIVGATGDEAAEAWEAALEGAKTNWTRARRLDPRSPVGKAPRASGFSGPSPGGVTL